MKYLLFGVFVIVPIAEIATFMYVGEVIGLWPTLGIILLTAFLGTGLLRYQGMTTLNQAQISLNDGKLPLVPVIHGVFLLIAGLLLLTPGFITDAVGFVLFIPPLRLLIAKSAIEMFKNNRRAYSHPNQPRGNKPADSSTSPIIEGEFTVADDDAESAGETRKLPKNSSTSDSPWRK